MTTPSPICTVNSTSTDNGVDVAGSSTITIALASIAGVQSWSISIIGTDENQDMSAYNESISVDNTTKTATLTMPSTACAFIFKSTVNNSIDSNNVFDSTLSTTFGVYVLTSGSRRLAAVNETNEGSTQYGWITKINDIINNPSATSDADASTKGILKLAGDLGGTAALPTVVSLTGNSSIIDCDAGWLRFDKGLGAVSIFQDTATAAAGSNTWITAQGTTHTNGAGGTLKLGGGAKNGSGVKGGVTLTIDGTSGDTMFQVLEVASGKRVASFFKAVTTTQVPTGDLVIYIANASTVPSSNPVSGGVLYVEAGALTYRSPGGKTTVLATNT